MFLDPRTLGADCDRCILNGCTPVFGAGPRQAGFAVVGEAPGCFLPGTLLLTPTDVVRIEDASVGQRTDTGQAILRDWQHDVVDHPTVQFKPTKFPPVTCTHDHKILVRTRMSGATFPKGLSAQRWMTAQDLLDWPGQAYACIPKAVAAVDANIEPILYPLAACARPHVGNSPCLPTEVAITPDIAFVLGAYLGDGFVDLNAGRVMWCFSEGFKEVYVDRLCSGIRAFGLPIRIKRRGKVIRVGITSRTLAKYFGDLFGMGALNKHVPDVMFAADADSVKDFLFGWYVADGSHARNFQSQSIKSISCRAIWQGHLLGRRVGVLLGVQSAVRGGPRGRYPAHQLVFDRTTMSRLAWPAHLLRAGKYWPNWGEDADFWYVRLTRMRPGAYTGPVYDKTTADHTYQVPVVVHNSNEVNVGIPFIAASGRMLDAALERGGIKRSQVRVTNALLCMPPEETPLKTLMEKVARENKARDKKKLKAEKAAAAYRGRLEAYLQKSRDKEAAYVAKCEAATAKAEARYETLMCTYRAKHANAIERNEHAASLGREPEALLPDEPAPPKVKLPKPPKALVPPRPPAVPDPSELEHEPTPLDCCRPRLDREIGNAQTLLLVGTHALQSVTGRDSGIFAEQGSPILLEPFEDGRKRAAVAVVHPAAILRGLFTLEFTFYHWVARAVRYHRDGVPDWRDPPPFYTGWKVERQLLQLLEEADRRIWADEDPIDVAYDVETDGKDPTTALLRCIGFAWYRPPTTPGGEPQGTTAVVGVRSCEADRKGEDISHPGSLDAVRRILVHPKIRKIAQNGVFERCVAMRQLGVRIEGPADDSMLAHHILESELPHSLEFLSALLLDAPSWKSLGEGDHGLSVEDDKQLWLYNSIDCWRTLCIMPLLRGYLANDGLEALYEQAIALQPIVADMRDRGMLRDAARFVEIRARLVEHKVRCEAEMRTAMEAVLAGVSDEDLLALSLRRISPRSALPPPALVGPAQPQPQQKASPAAAAGPRLKKVGRGIWIEDDEPPPPPPAEPVVPKVRAVKPPKPGAKPKKPKKRLEDACGYGWLEVRGVKRKTNAKTRVVTETEVWEPWDYARPKHLEAALKLLGIFEHLPKTEKSRNKEKEEQRASAKGDYLTMALANVSEEAVAWVGHPIDIRRNGSGYIGAGSAGKLISTFCDTVVGEDKRVHTDWKQAGTTTGRFCVAGETRIATDRGLVRIDALDPLQGYSVQTHMGRWRPVVRRIYKGREAMYTVTLSNGATITATRKHRFLTPSGWRSLGELERGSYAYAADTCDVRKAGRAGSHADQGAVQNKLHAAACRRAAGHGDRAQVRDLAQHVDHVQGSIRRRVCRAAGGAYARELLPLDAQATQALQVGAGYRGGQVAAGAFACRGQDTAPDSPSAGRFRVHASAQPVVSWTGRAVRTTACANADSRPAPAGDAGAVLTRHRRQGEGVLSRPTRVLRRHVRGVLSSERADLVRTGPREGTQQLPRVGAHTERPHLLVAGTRRADAVDCAAAPWDSARAAVHDGEARGGLCVPRAWDTSRSGRCVAHAARTSRARQHRGSLGSREWLGAAPRECPRREEESAPGHRVAWVVDIRPAGVRDVWDIEVAEDHSYAAEGFINHNSSAEPNLQNIPKWMRAFVPPEGHVLLSVDYAALELWIVAIYAQAHNMLKALAAQDPHRVNAELIFKVNFLAKMTEAAQTTCGAPLHEGTGAIAILDPDPKAKGKKYLLTWPAGSTACSACRESGQAAYTTTVKHLDLLRDRAKRFVYAGNYQASITTIWESIVVDDASVTLGEVAAIAREWKRINPELDKRAQMSVDTYHRRQRLEGAGYLESPILGRRRYWSGKDFIPSDAANYPIQSCGADIINTALVALYDRARALGAYLVAQVHDSLVFEVPRERAEELGALLEEVMPGPYKFRDIEGEWRFPIEWKVGEVWSAI